MSLAAKPGTNVADAEIGTGGRVEILTEGSVLNVAVALGVVECAEIVLVGAPDEAPGVPALALADDTPDGDVEPAAVLDGDLSFERVHATTTADVISVAVARAPARTHPDPRTITERPPSTRTG